MKSKIGIFIPTCNRKIMLEELLDKLVINRFIQSQKNEVLIFVVDNDKNKSSKNIVDKYIDKKVFYFNEKQRGYASVRNKCLEVARSFKCEYIIFIDDDEIPSDIWPEKLYEKITGENLDVVFGTVYPILTDDIPLWIKNAVNKKHAFIKENPNSRYTSNVIIRMKSIENIYFDNNFDLYGGEDVQFFKIMNLKGSNKIKFEKKSVVYEHMPINRTKLNYFVKRSYNSGISDCIAEKSKMNIKYNIKVLIKGLYNIISGLFLLLISLPLDMNNKRIALSTISKGFGRIYAIIFVKYKKNLNLNC